MDFNFSQKLLVGTLSLVLFVGMTSPAFAGPVVYDGGIPDFIGTGQISDPLSLRVEDFTLSEETIIADAHFWTQDNPEAVVSSFDYYIFTDAGTTPGTIIVSGTVSVFDRVLCNETGCNNVSHFKNSFDLDNPVTLSAGSYWFGVRANADSGINWLMANSFDSVEDGACIAFDFNNFPNIWTCTNASHAFQLTGPDLEDNDIDGDGIKNPVDTQPNTPSPEFSDIPLGGTTFGSIFSSDFMLSEAVNPDGIRIMDDSGSILMNMCGSNFGWGVFDGFGFEAIMTCGSTIIEMVSGEATLEVEADDGSNASIILDAGDKIIFDSELFTITNDSQEAIVIFVNGEEVIIPPGETVNIEEFLPEVSVGGTIIPLDSTTLLIGGLSSMSVWMIPSIAGIVGAGIYLVKCRVNRD